MAELSPAAQAVLDAYIEAQDCKYVNGEWIQDEAGQVAAALRAACGSGGAGARRHRQRITVTCCHP